jgi:hypothetical protein
MASDGTAAMMAASIRKIGEHDMMAAPKERREVAEWKAKRHLR